MTATLTTPADVWPMYEANVYGETRDAAITRANEAVACAGATVAACEEGDYCQGLQDLADARAALTLIARGDRDAFSLDGIANESWTIRADMAAEAASRAEFAGCHL